MRAVSEVRRVNGVENAKVSISYQLGSKRDAKKGGKYEVTVNPSGSVLTMMLSATPPTSSQG